MTTTIYLFIGGLSCLLFILFARRAGPRREMRLYAAALVAAALIYVAFALAGGAALSWIALESGGLVLFSLVALLGLRKSAWALSLGWAAHAVWDLWLHKVSGVGFVPEWYTVVCAGFDLFLAAYIVMRGRSGRG